MRKKNCKSFALKLPLNKKVMYLLTYYLGILFHTSLRKINLCTSLKLNEKECEALQMLNLSTE